MSERLMTMAVRLFPIAVDSLADVEIPVENRSAQIMIAHGLFDFGFICNHRRTLAI